MSACLSTSNCIVKIITEIAICNPMSCSGDNYRELLDGQGTLNLEPCLLSWKFNLTNLIKNYTVYELIDMRDSIKECNGFYKRWDISFYYKYLYTLVRYFSIIIYIYIITMFCVFLNVWFLVICTFIMLNCLYYFVWINKFLYKYNNHTSLPVEEMSSSSADTSDCTQSLHRYLLKKCHNLVRTLLTARNPYIVTCWRNVII